MSTAFHGLGCLLAWAVLVAATTKSSSRVPAAYHQNVYQAAPMPMLPYDARLGRPAPFYPMVPMYAQWVPAMYPVAPAPPMPVPAPAHDPSKLFAKRVETVKAPARCLTSQASGSENYPVYVLPPKNFQPIIYQAAGPGAYGGLLPLYPAARPGVKQPVKSSEELWYDTGDGLKRNRNNNNQISDELEAGRTRIVFVPVPETDFDSSVPLMEAVVEPPPPPPSPVPVPSAAVHSVNPYSGHLTSPDRPYKTKLPVGLTSFFLGGVRAVSGRHWQLPPHLVEQLEFMPNLAPEYFPPERSRSPEPEPTVVHPGGSPEKEEESKEKERRKPVHQPNTIAEAGDEEDLETQESTAQPAPPSGTQA